MGSFEETEITGISAGVLKGDVMENRPATNPR